MRSLKLLLAAASALLLPGALSAQNLIANPGFEAGTVPTGIDQVPNATSWYRGCAQVFVNNTAMQGSPDLFDVSSSYCPVGVPVNKWGNRNVRVPGTRRYVGFSGRSNANGLQYFGESVLGTITQSLMADCQYTISFWTSVIDGYMPSGPCPAPITAKSPQNNKMEVVLRKTGDCSTQKIVYTSGLITQQNWTQFTGTFSLTPSEVAIGFDRIEFRLNNNYPPDNGQYSHEVYLDDVSLSPAMNVSFAASSGCSTPLTVAFTSSVINCYNDPVSGLTYSWNFGNGNTSTQVNPTYTYAATGTYTVTLTVNNGAVSQSYSQVISVGGTQTLTGNILSVCNPPVTDGVYYVPMPIPGSNYTWSVNGQVGAATFPVSYTSTGQAAISIDWGPVITQMNTLQNSYQTATPEVTICVTNTTCNITTCITLSGCCQRAGASDDFTAINFSNVTLVPFGTPGAAAFPTVTGFNQQTMSGTVAIPQNGIINKDIYLMGNFVVNTNVTFQGSDIIANEAVNIYVNANRTVNMVYTEIEGCKYMWGGITNNGDLTITDSRISDARTAIYNGALPSSAVKVTNSFFNRNRTGVQIQAMPVNTSNFFLKGVLITSRDVKNAAQNDITTLNNANFGGNLATSIGIQMATMFTPITMKGSPVMNIPINSTFPNYGLVSYFIPLANTINIGQLSTIQERNYFDLMKIAGIHIKGSNAIVENNSFQNSPDVTGTGIIVDNLSAKPNVRIGFPFGTFAPTSNYFKYLGDGVAVKGEGKLQVINSNFKYINNKAVAFSNWNAQIPNTNDVLVKFNDFYQCTYDVYAFNNVSVKAEISINNSSYNAVLKGGPVNVFLNEVNKPAGALYTVKNNTFTNKKYGVYAANVYGANISTNTINISPLTFGGVISGVYLTNTDLSNVTENTIGVTSSATFNPAVTGIYTKTGVNNTYSCNLITGAGTCMRYEGSSPSNIVLNSLNDNPSDPTYTGIMLENNGYTGDIGVALFSPPNVYWFCNDNTFGDFYDSDTYTMSGSIGSNILHPAPASPSNNLFPAVNSTTSGFPFTPAMYGSSGIFACDAGVGALVSPGISPFFEDNILDFGPNTENAIRIGRKGIYNYIKTDDIPEDRLPGSSNFLVQTEPTPIGMFHEIDNSINNYMTTGDEGHLITAIDMNAMILPENDIDLTQQEFNSLYFTYLQNDTIVSDSLTLALRGIASKCVFVYGTSVLQARSLLLHLNDTIVYGDTCIDAGGNPFREIFTGNSESYNAGIYPNPSSGHLTVITEAEDAVIIIYNLLGEVVMQKPVNRQADFDVSHIAAGTYVYRIMTNKEMIRTGKLVITGIR